MYHAACNRAPVTDFRGWWKFELRRGKYEPLGKKKPGSPLLSINYTSPGKIGPTAKAEGAIGWKYDSPLSAVPAKFTAGVIDIGTADSLLRAAVR